MIELKDVKKEYSKGVAALNGINLKVEQGEFVFIVGDSGSGKSTLIKLIMKELDPTSGSIVVNGQNLNKMRQEESSGSAVAGRAGAEIQVLPQGAVRRGAAESSHCPGNRK